MTKIKEITNFLESWAPLEYQEDYDNAGLIVGNEDLEISKVIISLDVTEGIVMEAISMGANLIIAHHPIIFKGLKKLNGKNYVERTVMLAIKNDIAIYAIHTNLDHISGGVNWKIAEKLKLNNVKILSPKSQNLLKLVTFVPSPSYEKVLASLFEAGAGKIGNYENCSFRSDGIGRFKPVNDANPTVGKLNEVENVEEIRLEIMFPFFLQNQVLIALKSSHPYEEVPYFFTKLENSNQDVGAGAFGDLDAEMTESEFLKYLKISMNLEVIKFTPIGNKKIKTVAICGGAGSFLLKDALQVKAEAFITADYKYHDFFDGEGNILIADIGHYESEVFTKELIQFYLSKKFTNFATLLSETQTNPIKYYY